MSYKDLFIDQGCDFSLTITLSNPDGTAINLAANYSFAGSFKENYYYQQNATDLLTCTISDAPNGNVTISYPAANSANVQALYSYVYDIIQTNTKVGSVNTKIQWGILRINPSVTGITPTANL